MLCVTQICRLPSRRRCVIVDDGKLEMQDNRVHIHMQNVKLIKNTMARIAFGRVCNELQYKFELITSIKIDYNIIIHIKLKTIGRF